MIPNFPNWYPRTDFICIQTLKMRNFRLTGPVGGFIGLLTCCFSAIFRSQQSPSAEEKRGRSLEECGDSRK